jgi:Fe-S cluster assembly protein SufB
MEVELSKEEEIERLVESLKDSKSSDWEFHDKYNPIYSTGKGLNKSVVEEISEIKKEPDWMRRMR